MTMNREIKAELAVLKKAGRKIVSDWRTADRAVGKELDTLKKACHKTRKRREGMVKNRERALVKIDRRIAILEGRLA